MTTGNLGRSSYMNDDTSSSLNAVVDRIIEQTQSIVSSTASIRLPVLAKRYRSRPIRVRKPPTRHPSFRTDDLPLYQIQTSLVDDLREWIVHNAACDPLNFTNSGRSLTASSTTGSIASRQEMMRTLESSPKVKENATTWNPEDDSVQDHSDTIYNVTIASGCQAPTSESNGCLLAPEVADLPDHNGFPASIALPPSQPNSPPLVCTSSQRNEHKTVSRLPTTIKRKSLPSALKSVEPTHFSSQNSPASQNCELSIDGSVTISPPMEHPDIVARTQIRVGPEDCTAKEIITDTSIPPHRRPPLPPSASTESNYPLTAISAGGPAVTKHEESEALTLRDSAEPDLPSEEARPQVMLPPRSAALPQPQSPSPLPPKESIQQDELQSLSPSSPPQPQRPPPPVPAAEVGVVGEQPKARTAEEKRRAAHARRMKIAFA